MSELRCYRVNVLLSDFGLSQTPSSQPNGHWIQRIICKIINSYMAIQWLSFPLLKLIKVSSSFLHSIALLSSLTRKKLHERRTCEREENGRNNRLLPRLSCRRSLACDRNSGTSLPTRAHQRFVRKAF